MGRSCIPVLVFTTLLALTIGSDAWALTLQSVDHPGDIERLIKQLNSDYYDLRQDAWQKLRTIGSAAETQLEAALSTDDREARERIRMLLTASKLKVAPDASYQLIEVLAQFGELPENAQLEFLQTLVEQGNLRLALDVLRQFPDQSSALNLQQSSFVMNSALASLAISADRQTLAELLVHPFVREHYPQQCLNFWKGSGSLQTEIDGLIQQASMRNLADRELDLLIRGLGTLGRYTDSLGWIERVQSMQLRQQYRDTLEINQANWQYFWDQQQDFPLPEPLAIASLTEATAELKGLQKRLLLARLLNRNEEYEAAKACIGKALETFDAKTAETNLIAESLTKTLLLNGEVDLAFAYLEKNNPTAALQLANYLLRFDVARRVLQFDEDVEKRWKWFEGKFSQLTSLERKFNSTNDEKIGEQILAVNEFLLEAAEFLSLTGMNEDAAVLLEQLLRTIKNEHYESFSRRQDIVLRMAEMRLPNLWQVIDANIDQSNYQFWYLQNALFAEKIVLSNFWYGQLSGWQSVTRNRLQLIAGLLNEPIALSSVADELDQYVERIDRSPMSERQIDPPGSINFSIAFTYLVNGREAEFEKFATEAFEKYKSVQAGYFLGIRAFDEARWNDAIEVLSEVVKKDELVHRELALLMLSKSYAETNQPEKAEAAKLAGLLSGSSRVSTPLVMKLIGNGFHKELTEFELDRFSLAQAYSKIDDERASKETEILIYETLASDRFSLLNDLYLVSLYRDSQIRQAKALSAIGKVDEAAALVARHGAFLFSDASLSEELVAKMLTRGQTEVAERIFGLQAEWFTSQLQQCPNSNLLLNNFAWTCACAGQRTEIATYCSERSLQVRPKQKHYLDTLAALYFKQGRVEEAVELTRQCLTQDPENPHYRRQLKKFRAALAPAGSGN